MKEQLQQKANELLNKLKPALEHIKPLLERIKPVLDKGREQADYILSETALYKNFNWVQFGIGSGIIIFLYALILLNSAGQTEKIVTAHQEKLANTLITVFEEPVYEDPYQTGAHASHKGQSFVRPEHSRLYHSFNGRWRPVMTKDGETVFETYSKTAAFPPESDYPVQLSHENKSKIAIILVDSGLNEPLYEEALAGLPKAVTLSFSPYTRNLALKIKDAHQAGFENWLDFPSEPLNFPFNDRGPLTVLKGLTSQELIKKLENIIDDSPYIVGLTQSPNSVFPSNRLEQDILRGFLHGAGLAFINDKTNIPLKQLMTTLLPYGEKDIVIDQNATPSNIQSQLTKLEQIAMDTGSAVGYAHYYPSTIEELNSWTATLANKDIILVPASQITEGSFASYNPEYKVHDPKIVVLYADKPIEKDVIPVEIYTQKETSNDKDQH